MNPLILAIKEAHEALSASGNYSEFEGGSMHDEREQAARIILDKAIKTHQAMEAVKADNEKLAGFSTEELLAESVRRGAFNNLHGAVGSIYDHLEATGKMHSESGVLEYLSYRLKRDAAAFGLDSEESTAYWNEKIGSMREDQETAETPQN